MSARFIFKAILGLIFTMLVIGMAYYYFGWVGAAVAGCFKLITGSAAANGAYADHSAVMSDDNFSSSIKRNFDGRDAMPAYANCASHEWLSESGPAVNIDGTPMVGNVDIYGNPYGVTTDHFSSHDSCSSIHSFSSHDSFSPIGSGGMFD